MVDPPLGPSFDGHPPAEVVETHISVVTFVGDRAYKLKKPVDLGFLDFTTREARETSCHREVELNRRLAPDVYLGVLDVRAGDELVDHLVVMRRMPAERRLSRLAVEQADLEQPISQLARLVAAFHGRAERTPDIDRAGLPESVLGNWEENFDQLAPLVGTVVDGAAAEEVEHLARRYLAGRRPLLERRVEEGHICDGHGDLQAADIFCLDDGPRVLDCIEFNDRFRHGDVIADVAFLVMDLRRLGRSDLADRFLEHYEELSGEVCPRSLVQHYVAYRAHVRAKVTALRATQLDGEDRHDAVDAAGGLLHLALDHLRMSRVRLVLVGGLPGTGKSTVAARVGARLGWTVVRSDEVRKELAGLPALEHRHEAYGEGLYAPETSDRVYDALIHRARVALSNGESVVLDASWTDAGHRDAARRLADDCVADLDELRCQVPPGVASARIRDRLASGNDPSDATPEVASLMAAEAPPWPEAADVPTTGTVDQSLDAALRALRCS